MSYRTASFGRYVVRRAVGAVAVVVVLAAWRHGGEAVTRARVLGVAVFVLAFLVPVGAAFALPVNGDEITSSIDSGGGLRVAAVVISVGLSALGVLVLARFLHAAVDAA